MLSRGCVRGFAPAPGAAEGVAHPDIEWRRIAGIGNVLRHVYDEIDAGVVWRTATVEIEPLARLVQDLIAGLQQGRASSSDQT